MRKHIKKRTLRFIRLLTGVFIAYGLIYITINTTGANVWEEIIKANRFLLIFSLIFYGGLLYLTVERLNILLDVQNIQLLRWDLVKLTMVGNFFSLVIPGPVSGDLIKMIYLANQVESKKTESMITVFMDRVIGILGLLVVSAAMILLFLPRFGNIGTHYQYIKLAILGLGLVSIFGILIFFLLLEKSHRKSKVIGMIYKFLFRKSPKKILSFIDRIIDALELYRNSKKTILKALLLSILIHIGGGVNLFVIGRSVGEIIVNFSDYMLISQVGNLIALLPITPGGVGIRDIGAAVIMKMLGALPEMAGVIPIILTLIIIFWRLVGCGFFIVSDFSKSKVKENIIVSKRENPL